VTSRPPCWRFLSPPLLVVFFQNDTSVSFCSRAQNRRSSFFIVCCLRRSFDDLCAFTDDDDDGALACFLPRDRNVAKILTVSADF